MQVYNAMQLKNGAKVEQNRMGTLTQPIQFLPSKDKDEAWAAWNMDWLEYEGLKQIRRKSRKLLKNYKLAKGIIDKTDYIVEEDNEVADLIEKLVEEDVSALELKFYPIIPNVVNTLVAEFAKRNTKVSFTASDDKSYNEMLEAKREKIEESLLFDAQNEMMMKLMDAGVDPESEEFQEQMSPENLMDLPQIESFFTKSYRNIPELWAEHQHKEDDYRFKLEELEEMGFRDMLITDSEFWHFKMMEDDYDIEIWNPLLVFYNKSPDTRYISDGNWVGKFDMLSVADVIDKYGWLMTEEQLSSLEAIYPVRSAGYTIQGHQNDGTFYDPTRSHKWNTEMPSLGYRQFTSFFENTFPNGDIVQAILNEGEDMSDLGNQNLCRVTTAYWKSQRKVGYLTKVTENGEVITEIVDECYKIVDEPVYNTTFIKNKNETTLIFGEHIEWIWINQTWGGVKIGPHQPAFWGMKNPGGVNPIYLGINQNKIKPLRYQFRGDNTLYGCKLPVEGSVFSDRNTKSVALVDLMKPFQIGFNIVNNQIADILIDELGTIILLDHNALPQHSMGEDWGKHNYSKAYVAMKNFKILPLDTTLTNTENALGFQHYQQLSLEETNRLLSRVNLATYFKTQAFEVIGITPQRLGQHISQETATGIEQAVNASYAQTEMYFIQHSDYLMPRVHQMRTDLAQFYQSNNPSIRLRHLTNLEERRFFEIDGRDLLLRDINIHITTKANHRAITEQLKQLALENNTTGASIYDLGNIVKAESIAEITDTLKQIESKIEKERQQEMQHEQQIQEQQAQAIAEEERLKREFEALENQKDREARIIEAQIRAAGYGAMMDKNENNRSDYLDALDEIKASEEYAQTMEENIEQRQHEKQMHSQKMDVEQAKISADLEKARIELEIARENKNQYDIQAREKAKRDKQNDKKKKK